ncbi:hypothetical protein BJ508DRAFT_307627 [Ascobolus immersus RN42]|uniref:Uncharacterized protein n=1 Tax=Ascobolus immersus RN42 TaxID=1160509 RepID=A0A3N4I2B7_ASCIM|nr:hypothetical protein BJ508DRAFT_307627 [Ascobolus immersus RN42]
MADPTSSPPSDDSAQKENTPPQPQAIARLPSLSSIGLENTGQNPVSHSPPSDLSEQTANPGTQLPVPVPSSLTVTVLPNSEQHHQNQEAPPPSAPVSPPSSSPALSNSPSSSSSANPEDITPRSSAIIRAAAISYIRDATQRRLQQAASLSLPASTSQFEAPRPRAIIRLPSRREVRLGESISILQDEIQRHHDQAASPALPASTPSQNSSRIPRPSTPSPSPSDNSWERPVRPGPGPSPLSPHYIPPMFPRQPIQREVTEDIRRNVLKRMNEKRNEESRRAKEVCMGRLYWYPPNEVYGEDGDDDNSVFDSDSEEEEVEDEGGVSLDGRRREDQGGVGLGRYGLVRERSGEAARMAALMGRPATPRPGLRRGNATLGQAGNIEVDQPVRRRPELRRENATLRQEADGMDVDVELPAPVRPVPGLARENATLGQGEEEMDVNSDVELLELPAPFRPVPVLRRENATLGEQTTEMDVDSPRPRSPPGLRREDATLREDSPKPAEGE